MAADACGYQLGAVTNNGGLEQPVANWLKRVNSLPGVGGKKVYPGGHSSLPGPGVWEQPAYIGSSLSRELDTFTLATTRVHASKLATRSRSLFFFTHHPGNSYSALIVILGYIGGNDLKRQGQRPSPNASASGLRIES